jgi:N-acetylneuraminate lyase
MNLSGIFPAMVTPFRSDGTLNCEMLEELVTVFYKAGVDGLYVCGQTGEGLQQSTAQRKLVAEFSVRFSPVDKHVIVHVGANTTREAVELAQHAETVGAHLVSSLPPAGLYTFEEIEAYYRDLAGAVGIPVLLYHHPDSCPQLTPDRALRLCDIPNVEGFKFTDFNLYLLTLIRDRGLKVFNGKDEVLAGGLLLGANGGIGTFYNLFPGLFARLFALSQSGQWIETANLQRALNRVIEEFFKMPMVPGVREALLLCGLDCGECIAPRRSLARAEKERVAKILTNLPDEIAPFLISSPRRESLQTPGARA